MVIRTHWPVEHSCSHQVVHDLAHRPADQRAGFARWLAGRDCTECWQATRGADTDSTKEWLASKRAAEQQAVAEWATRFDMPPLEGPTKTLAWGERSRHHLMTSAHTALVVEGTWDEADWAELEDKARMITRAGWWIDQRDAEGTDLLELLDAAGQDDRGTENPFR
jgi:hypothetical protein